MTIGKALIAAAALALAAPTTKALAHDDDGYNGGAAPTAIHHVSCQARIAARTPETVAPTKLPVAIPLTHIKPLPIVRTHWNARPIFDMSHRGGPGFLHRALSGISA